MKISHMIARLMCKSEKKPPASFVHRAGRGLKLLVSGLMLAATPLILPLSVAHADKPDVRKMTPQERIQATFMLDIQANFYDSVKEDLKKGARINDLLPDGQLPILEAISSGAHKVFEILWSNPQLDINARNHLGENLMMYLAIEKKSQYDKIKQLLERGAEVNKLGWTPLSYAIYGNHPDIVLLLLKHGAFGNQIDPNGHTPLTLVLSKDLNLSQSQRLILVKALLEGGVNPIIMDGLGQQPIDYTEPGTDMHAFLQKSVKEYLIKHGYLYPDGSDNDGP